MAADPALAAYKLERIGNMFTGNTRTIFFGDSLTLPSRTRLGGVWEKLYAYDNLTARTLSIAGPSAGGADPDHWSATLPTAGTAGPNEVNANGGFVEGGTSVGYPLPVNRAYEWVPQVGATNPTGGKLVNFTILNSTMTDSLAGRFTTDASDNFEIRPIARWTTDSADMWTTYRLHDNSESGQSQGTGSVFINQANTEACAGFASHTITENMDGDPVFSISMFLDTDMDTGQVGNYLDLLGVTCWKDTAGQHLSYIGDISWDWGQIGLDNAEVLNEKFFNTSRLQHWLQATNVNNEAKHVFLCHMNIEGLGSTTEAEFLVDCENIALKVFNACKDALIFDFHVLFIVPYMHTDQDAQLSDAQMRTALEDLRDAARTTADNYSWVSVYSIYDITEGTFFNGATANTWLTTNGYDSFDYSIYTGINLVSLYNGDLLDASEIHPRHQHTAAFFYKFVSDALVASATEDPQGNPGQTASGVHGQIRSPFAWITPF